MRRAANSLLTISRGIRQKTPRSPGILEEGTTFSDVHSVVLDPNTKLPYPEEIIQDHIEKTSREVLKERNKSRYGIKRKSSGRIDFEHIPIEEQMVLLFPGQGSQFVGMGNKLLESPNAKRIFEQASEVLGYDLLKICIEGPATKLNQTLYCQPAVFVSSIAAFEKLKEDEPSAVDRITDVAGFSVGEFSALVAGNMFSFEDALRIVDVRCRAMHECNQLIRSGMMTVRVNAASRLDDAMKEAREVAKDKGEMDICDTANYLFCGVRVIGASDTCMKFLEDNQQRFAFQVVKRLAVSGAFHTRQMEGALEPVRKAIGQANLQSAICNVYSNYTGDVYSAKKGEIRQSLVKQITHPVKWEQIQQILFRKHQNYNFPRYIEIGAGKQLGAMLLQTSKKAYKTYEHIPC